jgi:large subunit ribosomal protein L31
VLARSLLYGHAFFEFKTDTTPDWREEFDAMKADIHPDYHFITLTLPSGTEIVTRSTYGKAGDKLALDIDPSTHPAWTGGTQQLMDRGGRLSKFNNRFGALGLGSKK